MRKKEAREVKPEYHPECEPYLYFLRRINLTASQGSLHELFPAIWDGCALLQWIQGISGLLPVLVTVLSRYVH